MLGICLFLTLSQHHYGTTFGGMTGSFNSSQINACVVGIGVLGPRFIVSSEGLGLHKMLPPRGFEPSTSRMPGKHRIPRPRFLYLRVFVYFQTWSDHCGSQGGCVSAVEWTWCRVSRTGCHQPGPPTGRDPTLTTMTAWERMIR